MARHSKKDALTRFFSGCLRDGVFIDRRDYCIHPILDLPNLRMHFFDQVMFHLRQFLDAFALFLKTGQEIVLVDGNPAHPPKAKDPANHSRQGHPEFEFIDIQGRSVAELGRSFCLMSELFRRE
jgi:hypothetical protein